MSSDSIKLTGMNRASYISMGLMITFCGIMFYIGSMVATISTKMESLPVIQQDIREMKHSLTANNGTLANHEVRIKKLEERKIPPTLFREKVEDHEKRLRALERK